VPETPGIKFQRALVDLGITRVICIDDIYDKRVDIPSIVVWAGIPTNLKQLNGILSANGAQLQAPSETFDAELRNLLEQDSVFAIKCQAAIDRIRLKPVEGVVITDEEQQLFTDRSVLGRLDELMEGFVQFMRLAPGEWHQQKQQIIGSLAAEKTLFIFDENLGQGVLSGTDQIREIAATVEGKSAYFGLLSYGVNISQEHERTRQFQEDEIAATAIPKKDLMTAANIEFLQIRLRAAILWRESSHLRARCRRAMNSAVRAAESRVRKLSPLEFDEVVFRSSYEEGVHEMDTLVRVYTNAFASQLRESLRINKKALADIDALRLYRAEGGKGSDGSEARKLQREEFYEPGAYVNGCRMPIDAGDVFAITNAEGTCHGEYVLLAPPCDLVIRSKGNDSGSRKVDVGLLCPIRIRSAVAGEKGSFELAVYGSEAEVTAQVEMTKAVTIELWLLDLCVLNDDGHALIRLNGKVPPHLSDGWKETVKTRLAVKGAEIAEAWSLWQSQTDVERAALTDLPAFRIPFKGIGFIKADIITPPRQSTTVAFGIKRTHRLSTGLTAELLQAYSDYVSRPARPHSLSRSSNT